MMPFTREIVDALLLLAKRNNKNCDWWCSAHDEYAYQYSICNICNEDFLARDAMEHATTHLRERNLLPFI